MLGLYPQLSPTPISVSNGRDLDGFFSLRTSYKTVIFEYAGKYDQGLLLWDQLLTGTGSIVFSSADGSNTLSTGGTGSGARAVRQTHQYLIYSPGKSRQLIMGVSFGAAATNVRRRAGHHDDDNGLFLEQTAAGVRFVTRTNASGSPVDSPIEQSAWNLDKLDGTGESGVTLDFTKGQALVIEFTGYNAVNVRFGFLLDEKLIYAHQLTNANASTVFGIATGALPIRYEIENTGVAAGANTMRASSCVAYDEDGQPGQFSYQFGVGMGTAVVGVTTRRPILSIRPKASFGGIVNRGHVFLQSASIIAKTNDAYLEIVRGGALTGAAFGSVGSNSITEFDTAATAITGGIPIYTDYAISGAGSTFARISQDRGSRYGLFNNYAGTSGDILSVVATSVTGTSNILAALNWNEQR